MNKALTQSSPSGRGRGWFKTYIRWRHSRGFGVHSPYAYKFVTDVLRPGCYGYYSYLEIDNYLEGEEINDNYLRRHIKFTIRLVIFLKAKKIIATPSCGRIAEITARSLGLNYEIMGNKKTGYSQFRETDLMIMENSEVHPSILSEAINNNSTIFAILPSKDIRKILESPIPKGLLLNSPGNQILIPRREMAYNSYDIHLPMPL